MDAGSGVVMVFVVVCDVKLLVWWALLFTYWAFTLVPVVYSVPEFTVTLKDPIERAAFRACTQVLHRGTALGAVEPVARNRAADAAVSPSVDKSPIGGTTQQELM
jgi:hypothetical protein